MDKLTTLMNECTMSIDNTNCISTDIIQNNINCNLNSNELDKIVNNKKRARDLNIISGDDNDNKSKENIIVFLNNIYEEHIRYKDAIIFDLNDDTYKFYSELNKSKVKNIHIKLDNCINFHKNKILDITDRYKLEYIIDLNNDIIDLMDNFERDNLLIKNKRIKKIIIKQKEVFELSNEFTKSCKLTTA